MDIGLSWLWMLVGCYFLKNFEAVFLQPNLILIFLIKVSLT